MVRGVAVDVMAGVSEIAQRFHKGREQRLQKLAQGDPPFYPDIWIDTPGQSNGFSSVLPASPILTLPPLRNMGRIGKTPPNIARPSSPIVIETQ
jgi:hypothetical protein